ncbi:MAG: FprA family A-type flavoprotein [Candidatus Aminicenantia bacterium]
MAFLKIKDGVYYLGCQHWERRLFDEFIPLPDGTSYNSYLITGEEKVALIDTVDPAKREEFLKNLKEFGVKNIDYVISNHAEQDHSGSIPDVLLFFPQAKVLTSEKGKRILIDLLHIQEDRIQTVKDGETISLGGKTLKSIYTPWVHWPETMITFLVEDKILFSCDFFGSHYAFSSLFVTEDERILKDAKRYYAEIMMPFRAQINKNIELAESLNPSLIAPSHGPIWKKPNFIINAYKEWVSEKFRNIVIIPYVSMHESTKKLVEHLSDSLIKLGIDFKQFSLPVTDIGELAIELVDSPTLIIGTPTVLTGAHPLSFYSAYLVNALRPKLKFATVIGSYGWGGKAVEHIQAQLSSLKIEFFEPVLVKGLPKEEDYKRIEALANNIFIKHKELGIIE